MKKFYIASAMFTESQKDRINKHAKLLRQLGYEVYVPHELEIPNADTLPNSEWACKVFQHDVQAIDECDEVLYFCEGANGDLGSAWECGYAYAKGKVIRVVELDTMQRCISLMVAQSSSTKITKYQT